MSLFKRSKRGELRNAGSGPCCVTLDDTLARLIVNKQSMTAADARSVPALYAGVKMIAGIVSMLPIHLYAEGGGTTQAINDPRTALLNDDTGDLLDGVQLKSALVEDYLLEGSGFAYVRWHGTKVASIHYVPAEQVSWQKNDDPIFKTASYNVQGRLFAPYQFVRVLNGSRDGVSGSGIVDTCNQVLDVARQMLDYELMLMQSGGNKKGFLKSSKPLTDPAMAKVREAWSALWSSKSARAMILNDGMDFQETSATSVEMQLDEHKRSVSADIGRLLNIPPSVLDGTATGETVSLMIKTAVVPILAAIETAINRALLLEVEKGKKYFAFDTKELTKGDILTRFQAYQTALKSGFMQIDEIRFIEDLPPLGINFVRLGLQDVYYDPQTSTFYTPNTDKKFSLKNGGGDDVGQEGTDGEADSGVAG